uniref:Uncharacterized protein n=1 Tax=Opuntia streptacantha TaxID=393608 RepID=A0A7C9DPQ7_OPUST
MVPGRGRAGSLMRLMGTVVEGWRGGGRRLLPLFLKCRIICSGSIIPMNRPSLRIGSGWETVLPGRTLVRRLFRRRSRLRLDPLLPLRPCRICPRSGPNRRIRWRS